MTERTFTYTLTDAKRLAVLHALGFMLAKLPATPPVVGETVIHLIYEFSTMQGADPKPEQIPMRDQAEAARAILERPSAPTQTDYFQTTKKGTMPTAPPEGAELSQVKVISAQKLKMADKYWTVIFAAGVTAEGRARPAGRASCWDSRIFEKITAGATAHLWIQESGNYLNIVGVRA